MNIEAIYKVYKEHPVVTTDSRKCPEGSMFFALKGESFNGNAFAAKALETGASVAVVDEAEYAPKDDPRYILVDDVLATLQALASYHRKQFKGPVIQVTGTNGKTTTKELIAAVLSQKYNVLYTQGNLNNHIGVPLTLLRLRPDEHEIAIIETGANHPGEIAFLANIVDPDYGLITNVGRAHIEGFGSFKGVKRTKGELYDYIFAKPSARIFLNANSIDLLVMVEIRGGHFLNPKCICYGHPEDDLPNALCTGSLIGCTPFVQFKWKQHASSAYYEVDTSLIGAYNLDNLLAAITVGLHFGIRPEDINEAIASYTPSLGRSEFRKTDSNEIIIDAYNANPTSMTAAIDNFRHISKEHKMVIIGDMGELGRVSEDEHQRILAQLIASDIEEIWLVGPNFTHAAKEMRVTKNEHLRIFADVEAVKATLQTDKPQGQCILVKGSNSTRLYQLPDLL